MSQLHDVRVYFAAERTQLAWVRTGIAIIALGFVVSRFGLFLQLLSRAPVVHGTGLTAILGVLFVMLGAVSIGITSLQHRRFVASLPPEFVPESHARSHLVPFSLLISALGVVLASYLLYSHRMVG